MSGLIYAGIVVLWAAFLVPMWLRRHDDAVEAKSVDRFSTAMKVLARRTAAADPEPVATYDEAPAGHRQWLVARLRGGTGRGIALLAAIVRGIRPSRHKRRGRQPVSLPVRRRRVLSALLGATVVAAILAGLNVVPWPVLAPVAVLLVGYVAHLRVQARRTADLARSRARARGRTDIALADAPPSRTVKITPAPSRRAEQVAPSTAQLTPSAAAGITIDAAAAPDAASASAGIPDGFAGPRVAWDPVPVPSPTYVTAPRAVRAVRSIDLTTDGAWTSGRLVADARAAAAAAVAPPSEADDEHVEARRAVGD